MTSCDLLVIGGGITGLGIARLAARNGVATVVLEREDLASGTSSRSSHMLHGGLRYLEHGRFDQIRQSLAERAAVARMAPGLAEPRRFLVPLYRGDRLGPLRLRVGLTLYDALAGSGSTRHSMVSARAALALEPALEESGLRGGGLYTDYVMDDARLAIAVARDASRHGAHIHTYTEAMGASLEPDGRWEVRATDRLEGRQLRFVTRAVVNATGPWTDTVRTTLLRSLVPGARDPAPLLRPSRGTHLVYPPLTQGHGLLILARHDDRVFFVVPFAGLSLVGTTEVEVPSPPSARSWRPDHDEVRYLREELGRVLPGAAGLPPRAVIAGLRPLIGSEEAVGHASREHVVVHEHGLWTVCGGKYTTFRTTARDVLERIAGALGRRERPFEDSSDPLPAPLADGADLEQAAEFAVEHEFARTVPDVIRRRTTLWLEPDRGRASAARIGAVMARRLGWSAERTRDEFHAWDTSLWDEEQLLQRSSANGRGIHGSVRSRA
jgi:glycerol-3-phosphate dehydrogenase